jgi:hypothetical protein
MPPRLWFVIKAERQFLRLVLFCCQKDKADQERAVLAFLELTF